MERVMHRSEEVSPCGSYRYWLEREWDAQRPTLVVCMLNPCSQTLLGEDGTLRALIHFATRWDYGGIYVVNLYAMREDSLNRLMNDSDRLGPKNRSQVRQAIVVAAEQGGRLLVAWGKDGDWEGEAEWFASYATKSAGIDLVCLGTMSNGAPKHPLARGKYAIADDQEPILWRAAVRADAADANKDAALS